MFSSQTILTYKHYWLGWLVTFEAHFGCHDILNVGTSPIKWRQRPDMTIAVDCDVKHQFKQIYSSFARMCHSTGVDGSLSKALEAPNELEGSLAYRAREKKRCVDEFCDIKNINNATVIDRPTEGKVVLLVHISV